MKLFIDTQYKENYGDDQNPYWKYKGGSTYVVENVSPNVEELRALVETMKQWIEYSNPMAVEYIIGWTVVGDDEQTEDEKMQMECEGHIYYPSPVLDRETGKRLNPRYVSLQA